MSTGISPIIIIDLALAPAVLVFWWARKRPKADEPQAIDDYEKFE